MTWYHMIENLFNKATADAQQWKSSRRHNSIIGRPEWWPLHTRDKDYFDIRPLTLKISFKACFSKRYSYTSKNEKRTNVVSEVDFIGFDACDGYRSHAGNGWQPPLFILNHLHSSMAVSPSWASSTSRPLGCHFSFLFVSVAVWNIEFIPPAQSAQSAKLWGHQVNDRLSWWCFTAVVDSKPRGEKSIFMLLYHKGHT